MKLKRMIVILKYLRIWTKIFNFTLCFAEFVKLLFLSAWGRWIFYLRTMKQYPLYVLTDLEIRKREAYRKQTVTRVSFLLNKVSALKHDRFMQASLCTVCLLFANTLAQFIKPIISVAGLNTYQFCINVLVI